MIPGPYSTPAQSMQLESAQRQELGTQRRRPRLITPTVGMRNFDKHMRQYAVPCVAPGPAHPPPSKRRKG
eukprot:10260048-Alexandrium_andersonii.AAC.1